MNQKLDIKDLIASQKPGWSLDQRFYTDPEIYQLELDHLITQNWIFAGHESQIPESGDLQSEIEFYCAAPNVKILKLSIYWKMQL